MEKVNLDYLRKQWKDELGYYWGRAQKEIDEYFEMIKDTLCYKAKDLKSKSREQVLKEFSLDEDRLKDPVFIPEILNLLIHIKKINYDVFPDNWVSGEYENKEHASYIWNSLIPEFRQVANKVLDFKVSQYNSLYKKPVLLMSEKLFINKQFEKFGLKQYDHHLDLINSIAYHDKFYVILPILLRTLFENILHDIFKISLKKRHKLLYFDKNKGRVADFSVLIELLNQLSQNEYKDAVRSKLNPKIIEILDKVKKKGNLTVHEVIRIIHKSYANEIQDEIHLALEALLISYNQLTREDKIIISSERLEKIEEKLGLRKKEETKKEKEQKSQTQDLDKPELEKYNFLARLIYLLQKYEEVKHYEREESETIEEIGKLIGKLDIIKFYKKGTPFYKKLIIELSRNYTDDDDTVLKMIDEKYGIGFNFNPSKIGFFISPLDSKKSYSSIGYGKSVKLMVLNNFIGYLKERMKQLNLYPLLDEVEEKTRIMKIFFKLRRFLEYLFSDDYLNPAEIKERTDERVISELNWIKQNDKELNDYFTVFRRNDEPSKYDKVLSLLNGKYLVQFRSHIPFKSTIKTNGKIIESSTTKKVNSTLYEIFESIKNHIKDNYKIKL